MKKVLLVSAVLVFKSFYLLAQCIPDTSTGLLAKWNFNGNANDVSGNGHHGVVVDAVQVETCKTLDSAYEFDGIPTYIDVPDAPELRLGNSDFTIAAWVYRYDILQNLNYSLISKRAGSGQKGYMLYLVGTLHPENSGKIAFIVSGGDNDPVVYSDAEIPFNTWQHIVVTYSFATKTIRFYVNGVLDGVRTPMPSPNAGTLTQLRIGDDIIEYNDYEFNGRADDIFMYGRELDSCDVAALYNSKSCGVLPVSLLSFSGILKNNAVLLNWQTAHEINTGYFVVEKSLDGQKFTGIQQIKATGKSAVVNTYQAADELPQDGKNFYRVRTIDKDGRISYSKIILLNVKLKEPKLSIYPNPVKNDLSVKFYGGLQQKIQVQIIDQQGKVVQQDMYPTQAGITLLHLYISSLAKGMYHLRVDGQKNNSPAFIKE